MDRALPNESQGDVGSAQNAINGLSSRVLSWVLESREAGIPSGSQGEKQESQAEDYAQSPQPLSNVGVVPGLEPPWDAVDERRETDIDRGDPGEWELMTPQDSIAATTRTSSPVPTYPIDQGDSEGWDLMTPQDSSAPPSPTSSHVQMYQESEEGISQHLQTALYDSTPAQSVFGRTGYSSPTQRPMRWANDSPSLFRPLPGDEHGTIVSDSSHQFLSVNGHYYPVVKDSSGATIEEVVTITENDQRHTISPETAWCYWYDTMMAERAFDRGRRLPWVEWTG